jgi:hypothetical protein
MARERPIETHIDRKSRSGREILGRLMDEVPDLMDIA